MFTQRLAPRFINRDLETCHFGSRHNFVGWQFGFYWAAYRRLTIDRRPQAPDGEVGEVVLLKERPTRRITLSALPHSSWKQCHCHEQQP